MEIGKEPYAKFYVAFWGLVAVVLWVIMTRRNINLLISAAIGTAALSFTVHMFNKNAWRGLCQTVLSDSLALFAFVGTVATTFMIVALISGDWGKTHNIPSTCLGHLHPHHYMTGLLICAVVARLFDRLSPEVDHQAVRRFGGRLFIAAAIMLTLDSVCFVLGWSSTPEHLFSSTQISLACHAIYLALIGGLCYSPGIGLGRWSRIALAISFGIPVGIFSNGIYENIHNQETIDDLPSALIFWHEGVDPACLVK